MVFTHKTRVQIPAWKAFFQADLAEWLRRMLKAHVRKSVGSTPTVCTFLGSKTMKRVIRGSTVVSIPACHAGDPGSIPGLGGFFFAQTEKQPARKKAPKKGRDVLELNQRPIGLQPIALPLS